MYEEKKIIRQCQAGDWSRFGQIYDAYIKKIYSFIYCKTMHREVAEDLTSQTFLKVVEKLGSFDPDTNFSAWFYAIARNNVIDYFRTEKQHSDVDDYWDLDGGEDVAAIVADRETLHSVWEYFKKLRPEQRELVLLRIWGNLSFKEIAVITGKSEGSLKMAFSRTLKDMKKEDFLNLILMGILIK